MPPAKQRNSTTAVLDKASLVTCKMALADLHADPANVNTHDDRNIAIIRNSLREFGQVEPLLVQKSTKKVIGGNGRLQVLLEDGQTHADVVLLDVDNLTATKLAIALNRSAKTSVFDQEALVQTIQALLETDPDFNTESIGFSDEEFRALLDEAEEPPTI